MVTLWSLQKSILLCKSCLKNMKLCPTLFYSFIYVRKNVESGTASHFASPPPQLVAGAMARKPGDEALDITGEGILLQWPVWLACKPGWLLRPHHCSSRWLRSLGGKTICGLVSWSMNTPFVEKNTARNGSSSCRMWKMWQQKTSKPVVLEQWSQAEDHQKQSCYGCWYANSG